MLLHNEEDARAFVRERCPEQSYSALEEFAKRLRKESLTQNLVASSSLDSLWLRHIADSAQLIDHVSRETSPWLDLGAGAGFPGVVVAMMQPQREVLLIEVRRLRIVWLQGIIEELGLGNCRVLGADVRRVATIEAAVISARAFAPLARLIDISARFSTNATEWVLPKGRSAAQDIANLPIALQTRFHVKQSVTDPEAGIITGHGRIPATS